MIPTFSGRKIGPRGWSRVRGVFIAAAIIGLGGVALLIVGVLQSPQEPAIVASVPATGAAKGSADAILAAEETAALEPALEPRNEVAAAEPASETLSASSAIPTPDQELDAAAEPVQSVPAAEVPELEPNPDVSDAGGPEAIPAVELPPGARRPSFDIVRITPGGQAVIAGRAAPGAEVSVQVGGAVVAVTRADSFGEWVAVPEMMLGDGPQELSLRSETSDGVVQRSEQVVTVVVPGAEAEAGEQAVAVLQSREGSEAPRVLQGAIADPGVREGELTLDAVQYDAAGKLILSGKARAGSEIRVFVDDVALGVGAPDAAGLWQLIPDQPLDVGRYQLRLEQIDGAGDMVALVELPFMRAPTSQGLSPGEVIVQPGANLWRIARATYGRGTLYTLIFLANADQIKDPDLIFPGQIFSLPVAP